MPEYFCDEKVFPVQLPFARVLSLSWYDGTTAGVAQCSRCMARYKYDIVDWDSNQERRIFAFSPVSPEMFDSVVELLAGGQQQPMWPFWNPRWEFAPADKKRIEAEIAALLANADKPEYVVASDRQFETVYAARQLRDSALERLPSVFDGLPVADSYDYWRKYLELSE